MSQSCTLCTVTHMPIPKRREGGLKAFAACILGSTPSAVAERLDLVSQPSLGSSPGLKRSPVGGSSDRV